MDLDHYVAVARQPNLLPDNTIVAPLPQGASIIDAEDLWILIAKDALPADRYMLVTRGSFIKMVEDFYTGEVPPWHMCTIDYTRVVIFEPDWNQIIRDKTPLRMRDGRKCYVLGDMRELEPSNYNDYQWTLRGFVISDFLVTNIAWLKDGKYTNIASDLDIVGYWHD